MSCSQFKQQRLPAWQPLLSPVYAAALMALVAAVFLPLGVGITLLNKEAYDVTLRYDNISRCTRTSNQGAFVYTTADGSERYRTGCVTEVSFTLEKTLKAPVFLYYGLTNFYQNHRRFSNSKNDAQLAGEPVPQHKLHDLAPLGGPGLLCGSPDTAVIVNGEHMRYADFAYAPAGLIPWSIFNDSLALFRVGNNVRSLICNGSAFSRVTNEPIDASGNAALQQPHSCHKKGIAWDTDASHKYKPLHFPPDEVQHRAVLWSAKRSLYREPAVLSSPVPELISNSTFFNEGWYAGELGHAIPVTTDEDLMVWARVASMPTFRKLYRVIDEDLPAGKYVMQIDEHYDVSSFGGEKSFTLATLSWIGGRNPFLANLYIVVGCVAGAAALVLMALQKLYGTRAEKSIAMLIAE